VATQTLPSLHFAHNLHLKQTYILSNMTPASISSATLGFARMGPRRELKMALEKHWKGTIGMDELLNVAHAVEALAWDAQVGIDRVTVGDYYLYDGVLSWADWLGITPSRFNKMDAGVARMFAMARGVDGATALSKSPLLYPAYVPRILTCLALRRHEEVVYQQLSLHGTGGR
jgi:hypothetical protein